MKRMIAKLALVLCFSSLCLGAFGAEPKSESAYDKGRMPDFKAASYSLSADSLKTYEYDKKLQGKNGLNRIPKGKDSAWILKGIKPGNYYLGLFSMTGRMPGRVPYPLFLNGKRLLFDKCAAPIKIGKEYYAETISQKSVFLKDGDELRLATRLEGKVIGPLNLYEKRPTKAFLSVRKWVTNDSFADDFFRLSVKLETLKDFNEKAKGGFVVENKLISEQTLNIELTVTDYFTAPVFEIKKTVKLGPREILKEQFTYPWGDSDRYKATLTVTNDKGHLEEEWDQILTPSKTKFRTKAWINDNWETKTVKDKVFVNLKQAEGGKWEKITLPFKPKKSSKAHIFWYKRKLSIPEWMKNSKRLFITFTRVGCDAEIYINGKKTLYVMDPHNPIRIEISDLIKRDGENELLLGTRDNIASISPEELKKELTKISRHAATIAPDGKACMDESYIEGLPETYIEDARILTSYRKKEMDVQYDISEIEKNKYIVDSSVYFKGKEVFSFTPKEIDQPKPEKLFSFGVSSKWENPILWNYWEPNLLCLKTTLKTKDGEILDEKRSRFGFREIWVDGIKLIINGTKVKLAAVAMADKRSRRSYRDYIKLGKRIGLTGKVHMESGPMFQDINDEEGILVFFKTPRVHGFIAQRFECDEYWKNAERIAGASVKAYWNHPSIIAWYLSNEFARQNKLAIKRLQTLGESVKKLDSSRLISFGCDLDVNGWNDHVSTHYPVDCHGVRYGKSYLPDSALWYPVGKKLEKGMKVPSGQIKRVANIMDESPITWGEKPIFINETGWKLQYYVPHGFARVFGDWAYQGENEAGESHVRLNRIFLSRHRDVEASLITPWNWCWSDPFARILPKVDIVPLETYSRWFEDESVPFNVNLHYDEPNSKDLKFSYKITGEGGNVLLEKSEELKFQPAELKRKKINLKIPEVKSDTKVNLVFTLEDKTGKILCERDIPSKIFSRKLATPSASGILLFDPNNETEKLFKTAKIPFKKVTSISNEILEGQNILVVGRNTAHDPILSKNSEIIENYVKSGGTVLIMNNPKGEIKWTPTPLIPIPDKLTSISFRRSPNHPVLTGFEDEDVKYWFPRHLVSQADYKKPSKGPFKVILDSATGVDGMEFSSLLEIPYGKGCYMASQIEFDGGGSNYARNPLAQKLLSNIVTYLEAYDAKPTKLGCVLKPGGNTEKKLASIGLIYENANADNLADFPVLFAEMDAVDAKTAKALKKFAANGGTVVLHKVNLKNKALANEICDGKIRLLEDCQRTYKGRILKTSNGQIIDGLGNADFYWKKLPITQAYEPSYSTPEWAKELIIDHPIEIVCGETFTYPGAIGKVKTGAGTVYVDQINWDVPNTSIIRESDRIASAIFSNLGCPIRKIKNIEIPENLKYETLDISKFLNRSLKDDKNNDGEGGWTDQGSIRDFSKLKPGAKKYNGVPFVIEKDKSCLVLRSKSRKPTVPIEVLDIPVDQKADVIYFLQSSAWTGNVMGKYRINYENGESFEIELADGVNMRDWGAKTPSRPFYNETVTKTQCAYTFRAPEWPKKRSIYMMAWLNPKSKLKIKSFDFISAGNGVPVLLAVTLGKIPTVAADIEIVKGDRDKAVKLYEEAKLAFKAGKKNDGAKLLLESIKADQSFADAYSRIARHYWDIGNLKKAEKQFRIALAADELAFDVYLMLGEMLEKQKRFAEALAVYEKSFKVDENQPRIHEARQRMHKVLKK